MLEDRDYMRGKKSGRHRDGGPVSVMSGLRGVTWVLIVTIAFYVLQLLTRDLQQLGLPLPVLRGLPPFFPAGVPLSWAAWAFGFVTHFLAHADAGHLFMNMLVLFFMGRPVEGILRRRSFLRLYLLTALGSALFWLIFRFNDPGEAVVGASGAVYGVVIAAVIMRPNLPVLLFGIIPMKLKWLGVLYIAYDLIGLFQSDGISHIGHLGGAIAGYLIMRIFHNQLMAWHVTDLFHLGSAKKKRQSPFQQRGNPPIPFRNPDRNRGTSVLKDRGRSDRDTAEDLMDQLDPILEKIAKHGIRSLTSKERRILDAAREQLRD